MLNLRPNYRWKFYLLNAANSSIAVVGAVSFVFYIKFATLDIITMMTVIPFGLATILDIPLSALADSTIKVVVIRIGVFLVFVGELLHGITPNLALLASGVFLGILGLTLWKGPDTAICKQTIYLREGKDAFEVAWKDFTTKSSLITQFVQIVCVFLGIGLYAINPRLPFLVAAGIMFIGFLVTFYIQEVPIAYTEEKPPLTLAQIIHSSFIVLTDTKLRRLIIGSVVVLTVGQVYGAGVLMQSILVSQGFEETGLALVFALIYTGQFAAFFLLQDWLKFKLTYKQAFMIAVALGTVGFLMTLSHSPLIGIPGMVGIGFSTNMIYLIFHWAIFPTLDERSLSTSESMFDQMAVLPSVVLAFIVGFMLAGGMLPLVLIICAASIFVAIFIVYGYDWSQLKQVKADDPISDVLLKEV